MKESKGSDTEEHVSKEVKEFIDKAHGGHAKAQSELDKDYYDIAVVETCKKITGD